MESEPPNAFVIAKDGSGTREMNGAKAAFHWVRLGSKSGAIAGKSSVEEFPSTLRAWPISASVLLFC